MRYSKHSSHKDNTNQGPSPGNQGKLQTVPFCVIEGETAKGNFATIQNSNSKTNHSYNGLCLFWKDHLFDAKLVIKLNSPQDNQKRR